MAPEGRYRLLGGQMDLPRPRLLGGLALARATLTDEAEARGAAATVVCGSLYLVGQYSSMLDI